jgi:predicted nucleotidyltransferase
LALHSGQKAAERERWLAQMTISENPLAIERDAFERVSATLDTICRDHGVFIPLAIESGSRAWGFPSPDSDYDCRFIFVRPAADYLSPWQRRDVIEMPLAGELDVNGWDLGKALKLLLKGNAVIVEWLMSPIAYRMDREFKQEFLHLARAAANRTLIARHYLHLGERQRRAYFHDGKEIQLKKIFYALRPAAALRWLRLHPDEPIAPMHFPTLLDQCNPSAEVQEIVVALLTKKAITRELGMGQLPKLIGEFIDREFELARTGLFAEKRSRDPDFKAHAEAFFRRTVLRLEQDSKNGRHVKI